MAEAVWFLGAQEAEVRKAVQGVGALVAPQLVEDFLLPEVGALMDPFALVLVLVWMELEETEVQMTAVVVVVLGAGAMMVHFRAAGTPEVATAHVLAHGAAQEDFVRYNLIPLRPSAFSSRCFSQEEVS